MNQASKLPAYDLAVAYRIYPKVSRPAHGLPFDDDKLRQAEICLRSFRKSLGQLRVKLWAILDGCPKEYEELFRRYFPADDLVLINLQHEGNFGTFARQLDILQSQTEADAVYFAEDDYFYTPNSFPLLIDFLRNGKDVQFVTAFDHPDCYSLDLHDFPKWIQVFGEHHWRNAASTCLTFLTTKKVLARYEPVFRTYERRNFDASQWVSITKYRIFDVFTICRYLLTGNFLGRVLIKSWLYSWKQNLFGRRAKLWTPIPTIAAHLDRSRVAPGFDLAKQMLEEDRNFIN
jgi:hypothetical protein